MIARNANRRAVLGGRCILLVWLLLPAFVFAAEPTKTESKDLAPEDLTCELILGETVKDISLTDQQGGSVIYRSSGSSMLLLPGRYLIAGINFKDGYSVAPCVDESSEELTLTPGKTRRPDIGMTLTPSVAVKRVGRTLKLDFRLLDASGRKYRANGGQRQAYTPHFVIYQGDREIGSGDFEYG